MTVEVVVPWRGGCPHRTRALRWVLEQYRHHRLKVTVAELEGGPWCKAKAVNPAVLRSDADVVVVADADVWCDVTATIRHVQETGQWAKPHGRVYRLSQAATGALLVDRPYSLKDLAEPSHRGVWGGGIVIAPKATLVDVPLDPRFVGWGQEDLAWGEALWLLVGQPFCGQHDLVHLWHPPPQRLTRVRGNTESWALFKRYKHARRQPDVMRGIVEEGRSFASTASLHPLPDHLAV